MPPAGGSCGGCGGGCGGEDDEEDDDDDDDDDGKEEDGARFARLGSRRGFTCGVQRAAVNSAPESPPCFRFRMRRMLCETSTRDANCEPLPHSKTRWSHDHDLFKIFPDIYGIA